MSTAKKTTLTSNANITNSGGAPSTQRKDKKQPYAPTTASTTQVAKHRSLSNDSNSMDWYQSKQTANQQSSLLLTQQKQKLTTMAKAGEESSCFDNNQTLQGGAVLIGAGRDDCKICYGDDDGV